MTRYVLPNLDAAAPYIRRRAPFRAGNLTGITGDPYGLGWLTARERTAYDADRDTVDYAVLSYYTPIAWHAENGWHIVERTFSPSTSNHQALLNRAIDPRDDFVHIVDFTPWDLTPKQRDELSAFQIESTAADSTGQTPLHYLSDSTAARRHLQMAYRLRDKGYLAEHDRATFTLTDRGNKAYVFGYLPEADIYFAPVATPALAKAGA